MLKTGEYSYYEGVKIFKISVKYLIISPDFKEAFIEVTFTRVDSKALLGMDILEIEVVHSTLNCIYISFNGY